ncbi:unnamed protein product [Miscanthus lutarioriparius]|uniref:F-box domain-containing protein n=1 Tax=Miscanthus lutarioriparius TaxID=422564 RepID=A0A811RD84_9POAL|nr:unnamed protein product [Miscanthus lutarioriparius]
MEEGGSRRAAVLPDELIVEILARLPAKSLCRCKCVSRAWRTLISDPDHRGRFAQTLSGLFFSRHRGSHPPWPRGFVGLPTSPPGVDTALSFLPAPAPPPAPHLLGHGSAGLLQRAAPLAVPGHKGTAFTTALLRRVQSGHRGVGCSAPTEAHPGAMTFFGGFLHFCNVSNAAVISVDTEVQAWRISHVPHNVSYGGLFSIGMRHNASYGRSSTISHSQGRLLYVYDNGWQDHDLSIYVLEDQDSEEWTWILKQSIDKPNLFGPRGGWDYCITAFHPNANLVFFYDWKQKTLMVYDMKHKDVHVICTLGEVVKIELDLRCNVHRPFLPYVPLYTRALTSPSVN